MQLSNWQYQNLALAAIAQSASLVNSLAVRGSAEPGAVSACVEPLFYFDPASISEMFPNPIQFSTGLRTLQEIFSSNKEDRNTEVIRYLLGILALRQKLPEIAVPQNLLRDAGRFSKRP